jgi:hypothetical protein
VDLLHAAPVKPHLQRVAEGMKARREARDAAAARAPVPAAATAATAPAPAAAPAAADQPPPAADEPITIGQGKSTPARDHMKELRKAAQDHASQRDSKVA